MTRSTLHDGQRVFQGVRFDVHAVQVPGSEGRTVRREVVVHPGAVAILPLLGDDQVVLIHNERVAAGQRLWELPAGTLEPTELPEVCAARELVEETGYRAGRIAELLRFYTTPGFCNEFMYAYLAEDLRHVGQELDEGETIHVQPVAIAEALSMVHDGRIVDGKTIAVLLYYHAFGRKG
jgi:ADP-ribose pyrophosphatase